MFASVTPLHETLRADIRRARSWSMGAAGADALEGALHLAARLGEHDVRGLLEAAFRHPHRRDLLLALAHQRLERDTPGS